MTLCSAYAERDGAKASGERGWGPASDKEK
jgi:hypothetical protein